MAYLGFTQSNPLLHVDIKEEVKANALTSSVLSSNFGGKFRYQNQLFPS